MPKNSARHVAMALLVRNEKDIIERNIRYHAAEGVTSFVVLDNGSTDGSYEKLQQLQQEYDMTLLRDEGPYQQARWMTKLAQLARTKHNAHFVILNDADEFWHAPNSTRLIDAIEPNHTVQRCARYNMLFTQQMHAKSAAYSNATYRVIAPINYARAAQQQAENLSMQLVSIKPKVIIKPSGLRRVKGGNHGAKHWFQWRSPMLNPNIEIFHFPIRGYRHFAENIAHRASIIDNTNVAMGAHYRRWIKRHREGQLQDEFERLLPTNDELVMLERLGVIERSGFTAKLTEFTI